MCSAGYHATLQLRSENGRATVSFNVDLGELLLPPSISQLVRRRRSSGYYRRQEKRKEARKAGAACNEKIVREAPAASTVDTVEKQSMEGNATIAEETVAADPSTDMNIENAFSPAEEAMEKFIDEKVAVQATSDQTQQKKAIRSDRTRWLCLLHGCVGEEFDSYEEIECDCCNVHSKCMVVVYDSEEEDDDLDPP